MAHRLKGTVCKLKKDTLRLEELKLSVKRNSLEESSSIPALSAVGHE